MNVQVFGAGCPSCRETADAIQAVADEMGVEVTIKRVEDVRDIVSCGILDTPGVVIVSAFDPVRREIARISLNKLIADGRIHPSRIEELVAETEKEIDAEIRRFGEEAMQEAQVFGLHDRVIELLGRLKYRTSYSQNVLRHSIDVAFITGMLAEELGMDVDLARWDGLVHDIGKVVETDHGGGKYK
jgi:ribonuclease Y